MVEGPAGNTLQAEEAAHMSPLRTGKVRVASVECKRERAKIADISGDRSYVAIEMVLFIYCRRENHPKS